MGRKTKASSEIKNWRERWFLEATNLRVVEDQVHICGNRLFDLHWSSSSLPSLFRSINLSCCCCSIKVASECARTCCSGHRIFISSTATVVILDGDHQRSRFPFRANRSLVDNSRYQWVARRMGQTKKILPLIHRGLCVDKKNTHHHAGKLSSTINAYFMIRYANEEGDISFQLVPQSIISVVDRHNSQPPSDRVVHHSYLLFLL